MQNFIHKKSRELGDLLTDTFQYIRIYYKSFSKGLLFLVLPLYLIQAFLLQGYSDQLFNNLFIGGDISSFSSFFSLRYFASIVLSILAYASLTLVSIKHVSFTESGVDPEPNAFLDNAVPLIGQIIGLYFVLGFILAISAFFFIIPAIFIGIKLSLTPAILIIEKRTVFESISRSWELTQGFWWANFGLYVMMYIIVMFTSYIIILPATIMTLFFTDTGTVTDVGMLASLSTWFMYIASAFVSLFISVIHVAFVFQLYNIVERKEGEGLRSKIEGMLD